MVVGIEYETSVLQGNSWTRRSTTLGENTWAATSAHLLMFTHVDSEENLKETVCR